MSMRSLLSGEKKPAHYSRVLVVTELVVSGTQWKFQNEKIRLVYITKLCFS